jgi:RNA polymerase sigma-70 factor (sigma-E family)
VGGEPVNTVVDGQSAEAVLDAPVADPVLAADTVLKAQPVDVLQAPEITAVPDSRGDPSVLHPQAGVVVPSGPASGAVPASVPGECALGPPAADAVPGGISVDGVATGRHSTLGDHIVTDGNGTAGAVSAERIRDDGVATFTLADSEPSVTFARPTNVAETLAASALVSEVRPASSVWDADRVVTEIYHGEYKSLVRLAVLLVHDVPTAEEVVQDAFVAMHTAWRRLRDNEKALSYLRQAVVNKSRSVLRHRTVVDKNAPKPAPDEPSAEQGAIALIERSAVVAALRTLPERQREAIVLRYYADLSEADIAATMGISKGAVKSHTARAMAALKSILEQET